MTKIKCKFCGVFYWTEEMEFCCGHCRSTYLIDNERLLEIGKQHPPPQEWYENDEDYDKLTEEEEQ